MPPPDAREAEHLAWLADVSGGHDPSISLVTAKRSRAAWEALSFASGGRMPVPAACTGPDGQMFYSWDRGRHHFEVEIIPGYPAEFFYRDRETEQFWGEDWSDDASIPPQVVAVLSLFFEEPAS